MFPCYISELQSEYSSRVAAVSCELGVVAQSSVPAVKQLVDSRQSSEKSCRVAG
jgi:hypothetical protein